MHEFAMCRGIVRGVLEEMDRLDAPARLVSVRVLAGRLHQIVPEYLVSAYELLVKDTPAEGSTLELKLAPVIATCRACRWQGELEPPIFLCADCQSTDLDVTGGTELRLESLEVETDE